MLRITWDDGNVTHHPDSETGNWQIEMKKFEDPDSYTWEARK